MIPGPNYVYKCPNCGNYLIQESIVSGNTLGAEIYSDGKRIAPMLPAFPDLTKCSKCNKILWLSKLKKVGEYSPDFDMPDVPEWQDAEQVKFLQLKEYFEALEQRVFKKKSEELFIRKRIWWSYNDRIRNGEKIFKDRQDELRWKDNLNKLIKLLKVSDYGHKIMMAEIKRNLGEFESCVSILNGIDIEDVEWLKEKMLRECEKKNRWVVQVNDGILWL